MALTVLSSNRVEILQARLAGQLAAAPLADPLAREAIVVPTYAMGRWLNLRIAQQQGVAANIDYPQPAEWLWTLAAKLVDDAQQADPFTADALAWRIFSLLPRLRRRRAFAPISAYLADDDDGIKRWQLAQRIATLFDRYQLYRPQWIERWTRGADDHWQAELWRALLAGGESRHRVAIIRDAIEALDGASAVNLPARVTLFTPSSLAPLVIEFVHALARATDVRLYLHSPTDQYWADLVSEKQRARRRLQNPSQTAYLETRNSLLTSWGRQGQALQDLLLDLGPVTASESDASLPPAPAGMLAALQTSLFRLDETPGARAVDDSLSLHVCHSPLRECQVLHDRLAALLERHPDLACEDILVMVPEIDRYAPYIEAVFQADAGGERPYLPWNLSDISVANGHPQVAAFLQLLDLPRSRFTRSEILALLDCDELRERFDIGGTMLERVRELLEQARVHWGIDAAQRESLGLPAIAQNTWEQGWDRMLAGFAMTGDEHWRGLAPLAALGSDDAIALARLRQLFERLVAWRGELARGAGAGQWQRRLQRLLADCFVAPPADDDTRNPLHEAIDALSDAGDGELSPALLRYWMAQQLATTPQPGRLYSGGITFCGLQPLRNIPFPVICVLGLQDGAFPRIDRPLEFDLMRRDWRPGDPRRADEDRYLMLETLLSARRYLYFSYCGRSLKDDSECQPSVLLRELLDYVDRNFEADVGDPRASQSITRIHPLQPFAARNFVPPARAYDGYWHDTARRLASAAPDRRPPTDGWPDQALPTDAAPAEFDIETLCRFFAHPVRYFFQQRLGLQLPEEAMPEDEERFALSALQKWDLAERLSRDWVAGRSLDPDAYRAEGLLPHGRAADWAWSGLFGEFDELFARLEPYRGRASEVRRVDCELGGGMRLHGEIAGCVDGGLLRHSASKSLRGRALVTLWLEHLALCAGGRMAPGEVSRLVLAADAGARFEPLDASAAKRFLREYATLFVEGRARPLPLFAETSLAWARGRDDDDALRRAGTAWYGSDFGNARPGERKDRYIRLALPPGLADPLDEPRFRNLATRVFGTAIGCDSNRG